MELFGFCWHNWGEYGEAINAYSQVSQHSKCKKCGAIRYRKIGLSIYCADAPAINDAIKEIDSNVEHE